MKVTFINPPQTNSKYKFLGVVAPSLGIGYMAAVLEKNGYEVDVLDATALELTYDEIGEEILKRNPDIISISALTPTIEEKGNIPYWNLFKQLKSAEI